MRRSLIIFFATLLGLLLAACAPTNAPAPTSTAPGSGYTGETPAATAATVKTPEATTSGTTVPEATVPATPAATPDINKVINPQPDDWKRGPSDAKVTIIEWGDFQ